MEPALSPISGCAEGNPGTGKMQHSQVVLNFLLPTDQQPPKAVQPQVGPFNHPAPYPIAGDALPGTGFFSAGSDMGCVAPDLNQLAHFGVVVALVHTQVLGFSSVGLGRSIHQSFKVLSTIFITSPGSGKAVHSEHWRPAKAAGKSAQQVESEKCGELWLGTGRMHLSYNNHPTLKRDADSPFG